MRISARRAGAGVPMSGETMKSKPKFLLVVSLSCLLAVAPCAAARRRATTKQPVKPEPAAEPAPTLPPPTLAQMPATPPQVSFRGGQLTISAENSTLGDILKAVRVQTGATIDLPGNAPERVVGQFGPAPARDVLASLLNGSHFNYLLLGSPTDPTALDRVILMAKSTSSPASNEEPQSTEQASSYNQNVYARPMPPAAAPGSNTVVVEGQDGDDSADDSADTPDDDSQADDQTDDQSDDQQATDDQQTQQPPDGQQQPVKTPEQLLQELQQRQQQMQQGVQPGMPRNFPNPGMIPPQPGGVAPNQPN